VRVSAAREKACLLRAPPLTPTLSPAEEREQVRFANGIASGLSTTGGEGTKDDGRETMDGRQGSEDEPRGRGGRETEVGRRASG
jgi:hypothetical protein